MQRLQFGELALLKKIWLLEWTIAVSGLAMQLLVMSAGPGPGPGPGAGLAPPGAPALNPGAAAIVLIIGLLLLLFASCRMKTDRYLPLALWLQILLAALATTCVFPRFIALLVFTAVSKGFIILRSRLHLMVLSVSAIAVMASIVLIQSGQVLPGGPMPPPVGPLPLLTSRLLDGVFDTGLAALFCYLILSESKARAQTEQLMEQIEELTLLCERQRIGRELHDSLGHRLVSLALQLDIAAKYLKKEEIGQAQEAIQLARSVADKSLVEIREAVTDIRGSNFDFETSMLELVNEIQQDAGIRIELSMDPSAIKLLSLESGRQLFSITKECLNNVRKHAKAQSAAISLYVHDGKWSLSVSDDGIGLLPNSTEGFGMSSLRERATAINAELSLESKSNNGTRVTVTGVDESGAHC